MLSNPKLENIASIVNKLMLLEEEDIFLGQDIIFYSNIAELISSVAISAREGRPHILINADISKMEILRLGLRRDFSIKIISLTKVIEMAIIAHQWDDIMMLHNLYPHQGDVTYG